MRLLFLPPSVVVAAAIGFVVKKLEMDCCFFACEGGRREGLLLEGAIIQLLIWELAGVDGYSSAG